MTPLFSLSCVQVLLQGVRPGSGRKLLEQAVSVCGGRIVDGPDDPNDLYNLLVINGQKGGGRSRAVQALAARGAHIVDRDEFEAYVRGASTLYGAQERTARRHEDRIRAAALMARHAASPYRVAF